ncbi:glycosyltransferase family 39 protein [Mariprofundus erugo]|uniref:Glycosyltransferase family 39 protein n=1 Tax=Mariprofundus erugo TaxID=2528639 RepID=A0A5R9GK19_9PROT|nr:glycosyltransferase family 39 protein [Mariprofundus erugo]TLS66941.1 glycosyltransferase family 39 protein [Mariprofundus erugo]
MHSSSSNPIPVWLLWMWALLTLATLGLAPLFDYDETIYAQTAVDMMHHGEWIVPTANGLQFFEKPPFTYYLMDLCFSVFGENAFAARLPSSLFTLATALLLLHFGTRLHSRHFGLAAAAIFLSMLEVGFLAHAAILDAVLNFFIAACLLNYALWLHGGERRHALWTAAMMGAAVSIKGPVGAVVPVMVIVAERLLVGHLRQLLADIPWLTALPLFFLTATPWYLMILIEHGPGFLYEFIWVQNIGRAMHPMQGHGGGLHYYIVVFVVSVLPWLAVLPRATVQAWQQRRDDDVLTMLSRLAMVLIILVIVLFTFAQTKLPHYISCIYPGVALLLASAWIRAVPDDMAARRITRMTLSLLVPVALLLISVPLIYPWLQTLPHHPRAVAILAQDISPSLLISCMGGLLLLALVWLLRQASGARLLFALVVTGMALQFTLLVGAGGFAGRLMQAPTMAIVDKVTAMPEAMPFYSYNLNAPSISFYAGRNYRMELGAEGAGNLSRLTPPFALMLRSESRPELPWLSSLQPAVDQGGYLLYLVTSGRNGE